MCTTFSPVPSPVATQTPVASPSSKPSPEPSSQPNARPSSQPSARPSSQPSARPSQTPVASPVATNCGSDEWRIAVVLTTDWWPSETSWVIKDPDGTTIASRASYVDQNAIHYDYACIDKSQCYTFTINDTYGDGLVGGGKYDVELYDKGGVPMQVVASGGDFTFIGECHTISGNV